MARRVITPDFYQALVAAFRDYPEQPGRVAHRVGCGRRTADKAWHFGFRSPVPELRRPIKDIIAEEQEQARRMILEEQEAQVRATAEADAVRRRETLQRAIEHRAKSRALEGEMIGQIKQSSARLLATLARATFNLTTLTASVDMTLKGMGAIDPKTGQGSPRVLSPAELRTVASLQAQSVTNLQQVTSVVSKAMEMERLLLGEPQHIIEHQYQDVTATEALQKLAFATRAMELAQLEAGRTRALPPGQSTMIVEGEVMPAPVRHDQLDNVIELKKTGS